MMQCAYCFKDQETLIDVHGYGVCDWTCGIKLKNITDELYKKWKADSTPRREARV